MAQAIYDKDSEAAVGILFEASEKYVEFAKASESMDKCDEEYQITLANKIADFHMALSLIQKNFTSVKIIMDIKKIKIEKLYDKICKP